MSIKVLVADDSITIQKVIGIIFGGDEYSLTVVDNGKAAVDKAREIIPDILLIDALMPGMTGYEVAEAVRSTPSLATKPILILTGSFEPFDEEKAKKCGADDFISKPFESQQIITKVKELLNLGNSRTASVKTVSSPPAEDFLGEQAPDIAPPVFEVQSDEAPQSASHAAPTDIWGAFTPEVEPPIKEVFASSANSSEPDVFAIVSEEDDAKLVQTGILEPVTPQQTGSQWISVEENTFEFEEEIIADQPQAAFAEQSAADQSSSFGDIAFNDIVATPAQLSSVSVTESSVLTPAFGDFVASSPKLEPPSAPFAPLADPVAAADPATPAFAPSSPVQAALSEEQLKEALAGASREVIERIVWEIVPDLAEALIREAIRKIKEGE